MARAVSDPTCMEELFRATLDEYPGLHDTHDTHESGTLETDDNSAHNSRSHRAISNVPPAVPSVAVINSAQPRIDSAQARIAAVRQKVSKWNIEWGPTHQWPRFFENAYAEALEAGCIDAWAEKIQLVVDEGRNLVREIGDAIEGTLPLEDWHVRDIWRSGMEIMRHLFEGISTLETRLEIVAPFPENDLVRLAVRKPLPG